MEASDSIARWPSPIAAATVTARNPNDRLSRVLSRTMIPIALTFQVGAPDFAPQRRLGRLSCHNPRFRIVQKRYDEVWLIDAPAGILTDGIVRIQV
jgi:hypothetical protein